ncbi:hypothetical protein [Aureivirga marina]|uniref:hypothetical protein n=1 Tax=Aureivirga marina TaxID=1182451 RepID=UPI0018CA19B1|nr:hypothetical protein [Aureivirga marina]
MKKITKFTKYFTFILLISLTFSSCGALVRSNIQKDISVENGSIPEEIGQEGTTLICVLKGRSSRDKYMKKHVKKKYHGKYVFVLESDLNSDKYKDVNIYRFLFDYNANSVDTWRQNADGTSTATALPTSSYFIKDRKENKIYSPKMNSSFFSKYIEAYVIQMENARIKK